MSYFDKNIICQDYQILAERRIAFLMAWHPRLGKNSLISKKVPKDVAKLIGRKYITKKSQCSTIFHGKPIVLNRRDYNRFSLIFDKVKTFNQGMNLVSFNYLNCRMNMIPYIHIETPDMFLLWVNDGRDVNHKKLVFECCNPNDEFIEWINYFDSHIKNKLIDNVSKVGRGLTKNNMFYNTSFKQKQSYGTEQFSAKIKNITDENIYIKSKGNNQAPISFVSAYEQKYIGSGSKVKLLLKFEGLWRSNASHLFPSWIVEQILVKTESEKFYEGKLRIHEDDQ